jgi:translation initiation factor IF-3
MIKEKEKQIRVNERIRIPQIRLIGLEGEQIGVMPTRQALALAFEKGFDLVEISPNAKPPVCRIMDFGKYKYELSKKAKASKKKQHFHHLKEMHFRPKTEEHDYQFKLKHIKEFLLSGNKVKASVEFRGREMAHQEFGQRIVKRLEEDLKEVALVEQSSKMEGSSLSITFTPKSVPTKAAG